VKGRRRQQETYSTPVGPMGPDEIRIRGGEAMGAARCFETGERAGIVIIIGNVRLTRYRLTAVRNNFAPWQLTVHGNPGSTTTIWHIVVVSCGRRENDRTVSADKSYPAPDCLYSAGLGVYQRRPGGYRRGSRATRRAVEIEIETHSAADVLHQLCFALPHSLARSFSPVFDRFL
jgi:tRNA(His) 5'-end guanylyltransferase